MSPAPSIVSTLGAYSLVKHHPPGSKVLFQLVLATLMFSPYVTQIPRYLIINEMGLVNHYSALILPGIVSAYNFFLIKQFVEQLPNDLLEAARIDGSGEYRIYWTIIMPMLAPAWSTLMVFSFVSSWNDYFSPLIYINDPALQTLPLALNTRFRRQFEYRAGRRCRRRYHADDHSHGYCVYGSAE